MQQLPEIIFVNNVLYTLYTTPLLPWLRAHEELPAFDQRAPTCTRGYIGKWKVVDDVLWLIGLYAWRDGVSTGVSDLFDGRREVPADWFSGPLVIEPASSEIVDGAQLQVSTLLVEAGRIVANRAVEKS